jgi:hypothetical protein
MSGRRRILNISEMKRRGGSGRSDLGIFAPCVVWCGCVPSSGCSVCFHIPLVVALHIQSAVDFEIENEAKYIHGRRIKSQPNIEHNLIKLFSVIVSRPMMTS